MVFLWGSLIIAMCENQWETQRKIRQPERGTQSHLHDLFSPLGGSPSDAQPRQLCFLIKRGLCPISFGDREDRMGNVREAVLRYAPVDFLGIPVSSTQPSSHILNPHLSPTSVWSLWGSFQHFLGTQGVSISLPQHETWEVLHDLTNTACLKIQLSISYFLRPQCFTYAIPSTRTSISLISLFPSHSYYLSGELLYILQNPVHRPFRSRSLYWYPMICPHSNIPGQYPSISRGHLCPLITSSVSSTKYAS